MTALLPPGVKVHLALRPRVLSPVVGTEFLASKTGRADAGTCTYSDPSNHGWVADAATL